MNSEDHDSLFLGSEPIDFINARSLRKAMTKAEALLWNALRNNRLNGFKFRRQHTILGYIADFYCHEVRLVVEVDGGIHNNIRIKEYDERRTYELNTHDVRVIRFTNQEIMNSLDLVLFRINMVIQQLILLHIDNDIPEK